MPRKAKTTASVPSDATFRAQASIVPAVVAPVLTPAEVETQAIERISRFLEARIVSAQKEVVEFAAVFAKKPVHALEWSSSVFTAAAELEICQNFKGCLTRGASLKGAYQELREVVMARRNTQMSAIPNLMAQELQQAAARLYADLAFYVSLGGVACR